ncbi:hypothetical protein SDC64_01110 [Acinetobacter haemolyticus]|uniref:DUF7940 domain-containing protein n=1 Tax=Acinetobacter haemolyticus TaxID=29430 RepID=UPI002A6ABE88|nr:hypothetical protein [Acinetobacter haemolyticus]WPO67577.1 hypothetical protein SDC64_01110 [Acinetobacter haemolyticus]
MKKTTRKVPQSVKTQRKIDTAVGEALKQQAQSFMKVKQRDDIEIEQLEMELSQAFNKPREIVPDYAGDLLDEKPHTGLLVKNPHTFWKWLSTWAFAAIGYVSLVGLPPEIIALVPEASQGKVTAVLALLGFLGRFVNQSRGK